jgi:hypothetical protein
MSGHRVGGASEAKIHRRVVHGARPWMRNEVDESLSAVGFVVFQQSTEEAIQAASNRPICNP